MPPIQVSVILPVYNGAAFVGDAIESVLAQQHGRIEAVVVDDGSVDDTPAVLRRFGDAVRVIRQANRGLPAARNAGIREASGELLSFLDADDLQPPGFLDRFLDAAQGSDASVFHSGFRARDFSGRDLYGGDDPLAIDDDPFHQLVIGGSPAICALVVRRSVVARVGLFDETLRLQEDWDFWLRLAASGERFAGVPGDAVTIRRHDASMSGRAGCALALTGLSVLERALRRHGACTAACTGPRALAMWRLGALRATAREHAGRLPVSGRLAHWVGTGLAIARRPRLLRAALGRDSMPPSSQESKR